MSISDIRKSYDQRSLDKSDLSLDPIKQFERWLEEALASDILEPTAVSLATATPDGRPSTRMVLLKGVSEKGFVFYSNYESRKGRELAQNPHAALCFYWNALERQVRIEGEVTKLPRDASETYFRSRPYGSQIGALASHQSEVLVGREVLEKRTQALEAQHAEGEVPLPDYWGGYLLSPSAIEFWQGRPSRLHDRLKYLKKNEGWRVVRLSP